MEKNPTLSTIELDSESPSAFKIPLDSRRILLPSRMLSVTAFLHYENLPGLCILPEEYSIEQWFSLDTVDLTFQAAHLPQSSLPPYESVLHLLQVTAELPKPSFRSINALHLQPGSFPCNVSLWVISYWAKAHACHRIRQQWKDTIIWMERKSIGSVLAKQQQCEICNQLSYLQWGDQLQGQPITFGQVETLSILLSDRQLYGNNICQLIGILWERLSMVFDSLYNPCWLIDLEFGEQLVHASTSTLVTFASEWQFTVLRDAELNLQHGFKSTIGRILHVNGNHYTFFVLNIQDTYLGYEDSMGEPMPKNLRAAFLWWIQCLTGEDNTPFPEMWLRELPVTKQRGGDDFSCGILALNGLAHHLSHVPLLSNEARGRSIAEAQMKAFLDVCKIHAHSVSDFMSI